MDLLIVVLLLCLSWYISKMAEEKGRSPLGWFILGMLFHVFALLAIYFLPPLKKQDPDPNTIEVEAIKVAKPTPFDTHNWYYLDKNRHQQGPYPFSELQRLWQGRTIDPQTYVWCETMESWKHIADVANLEGALKQ